MATDLHRERPDPNDNKKEKNPDAFGVDEFMEVVARKSETGEETLGPGMAGEVVDRRYGAVGDQYARAAAGKWYLSA